MKIIGELNDRIILGYDGFSTQPPRITARAIVKNQDNLYAVMYSNKFKLYSLPGGGVEEGEDVLTALHREIYEEVGCVCDDVKELGIVKENRASLDYTQINYYFVVNTFNIPNGNHLTSAEKESQTVVQWHTFDELVKLINEQEIERVQGKYLKARDVIAIDEYASRTFICKYQPIAKNNDLLNIAKILRRNMTKQEKHLWYDYLQKYPIKIYKQKIIDNYIADFYCHQAKLVIEIDGSQHYTDKGKYYDEQRTEKLEKYGIMVLRFSNLDIDNKFEGVCYVIDKTINERISN